MPKQNGLKVAKLSYLLLILNLFGFQSMLSQNLELKIEGVSLAQTRIIDSIGYKKQFKDLRSLTQQISDLLYELQLNGYIENELISLAENDTILRIATLDLKTKFHTIYIYYPNDPDLKSIVSTILEANNNDHFSVSIGEVQRVLSQINELFISQGNPFSSVRLDEIKKRDSTSIEANLIISPNEKRTINNIIVKGYENFPKAYLKHFAKIKNGASLDLIELKNKSQLISSLPFANQIRDPEILFTKDSSSIYLYLEKVKANSFDGFIGFGTDETTNKLEFYGNLDLNLLNNLNFGESLNIKYRSDGNDQRIFNVNIVLPYLFNTALGSELELNLFKQDSTFTTARQRADLFYQIDDKQKIALGITASQSNNLSETIVTNNVDDYDANFFTLGYSYIKRQFNDPLFPIAFHLESEVGFGKRNMENDEQQQSIYGLNAFKIFNLNQKNSFFLQLTSHGINSDTYLNNELLRLGGINSIRGFEENSLFASLFGVLRTEYRYRLNSSIYVHSIIDAAYLENKLSNTKDKLLGFGFGFGLLTRSGLLKFNYANGKSENQKFKLQDSKVHLSLSLNLF